MLMMALFQIGELVVPLAIVAIVVIVIAIVIAMTAMM
jgi:hypothetical protein